MQSDSENKEQYEPQVKAKYQELTQLMDELVKKRGGDVGAFRGSQTINDSQQRSQENSDWRSASPNANYKPDGSGNVGDLPASGDKANMAAMAERLKSLPNDVYGMTDKLSGTVQDISRAHQGTKVLSEELNRFFAASSGLSER
jgi:hypothetical protein